MKPGCICKEGFVRDGNNKCVPEYPYCAPKCNNPYEEFQMCPCDQECNKPKVKVFELVIFILSGRIITDQVFNPGLIDLRA